MNTQESKHSDDIKYANGTRYEAVVPDTLDLAYRAELAMHGIAGTTDPDNDYLMWFVLNWHCNPPHMRHSGGADVECTPKFYDALTMLRQICGSRDYIDTEQGMEKTLLSFLNKDDGLYDSKYSPEQRPWHMEYYPGVKTKPEDYAILVTSGIMLLALMMRDELDLTSCEDQIKALVSGMEKAVITKDDYAYFPEGGGGHPFAFPRSTGWGSTVEAESEHEGGEESVVFYQGYQMRGLAMWAARSGDKQALELAGKLARYVMKSKFWNNSDDPSHIVGGEQGHVDSHFHARAGELRGLLEYGIVANDTRACDFVRSSYEYMRTYGISRIGFMPCLAAGGRDKHEWMEGCMLGDLLALTIKMSRAGIGDYWDDADRIIRNQLVEAQFTRSDLLDMVSQHADKSEPEGYPNQICTENVHERMLGTFASLLMPTSVSGFVMQCCTGNATRGLAYAWDGILNGCGDEVQVNLLLNRASAWLDIDSYLPYEGKVVLHNKTAWQISVRIPAWVNRKELQAQVNGTGCDLSWTGAYLTFSDMKPGDTLQLDFPVTEETVHLTALTDTDKESEKPYTTYEIVFRGNTVVDISPRKESPDVYPIYLRDHMKKDKAPMKTKTRFVSEQPVFNW